MDIGFITGVIGEHSAVLGLLIAYIGTPLLAWASSKLIDRAKMKFAYLQLKRDPLYDQGSKFHCILRLSGSKAMGRCFVYKLEPGRIEVRGLDADNVPDGTAMSWPVRDFMEKLDPVAEV